MVDQTTARCLADLCVLSFCWSLFAASLTWSFLRIFRLGRPAYGFRHLGFNSSCSCDFRRGWTFFFQFAVLGFHTACCIRVRFSHLAFMHANQCLMPLLLCSVAILLLLFSAATCYCSFSCILCKGCGSFLVKVFTGCVLIGSAWPPCVLFSAWCRRS